MLKSPVLLISFNRPNLTLQVFNQIRVYQPKHLYFAVDGYRDDVAGEKELCEQVEKLAQSVDWECKVSTRFSKHNQGMRLGVLNAINWFFDNEEKGIILEDDVLPDETFFSFCNEMLEKYRHDSRIMHVSGCNLQFGKKWGDGSYYFSHHANIWGWATWKRAWNMYDGELKTLPKFVENKHFSDILIGDMNKWQLNFLLKRLFRKLNTWDYQWTYSVLSNSGLSITPNVSLVTNRGYGSNATTAFYTKTPLENITRGSMADIIHPSFVLANSKADRRFLKITMNQVPLIVRFFRKIVSIVLRKSK